MVSNSARAGNADWHPSASFDVLRARARMLAQIRVFFAERGVLEVETPILSHAGATDPALASLRVEGSGYWLHTSPEFPMKRLLAAGSGSIYQICRVFRAEERGRLHHPEFTMLEWYRPAWTMFGLIEEVGDLVRLLLDQPSWSVELVSYRELFRAELDLDPWDCSEAELQAVAAHRGLRTQALMLDCDGWLDLLLTHCLERNLGRQGLTFLHSYPPSQASLARISEGMPPTANRFELYVQGIELANGFEELTDAEEQIRRFEADQVVRRKSGQPEIVLDSLFLAALTAGLPASAGVALGLDRLLMLACGAAHIDQVLAFPIERA